MSLSVTRFHFVWIGGPIINDQGSNHARLERTILSIAWNLPIVCSEANFHAHRESRKLLTGHIFGGVGTQKQTGRQPLEQHRGLIALQPSRLQHTLCKHQRHANSCLLLCRFRLGLNGCVNKPPVPSLFLRESSTPRSTIAFERRDTLCVKLAHALAVALNPFYSRHYQRLHIWLNCREKHPQIRTSNFFEVSFQNSNQ